MPTQRPYLTRDWLVEDARHAVLKALDKFAVESGLSGLPAGQPGATDADLPELFKAIDAQVNRLIARAGYVMPDHPYPAEFVQRTAQELAAIRRRQH